MKNCMISKHFQVVSVPLEASYIFAMNLRIQLVYNSRMFVLITAISGQHHCF